MFDLEFIRNNWLYIAGGLGATLGITLVSFLLAFPLALLVASARRSSSRPLRAMGTFYVWLLVGIPLLIQIPFYFLLLPQLRIVLPGFWAAVFPLAFYYSPRLSELFFTRPGFLENLRAGAWHALVPGVGSELVSMIKDSTLLSMTGFLHDIYWRANRSGRAEFHLLEALAIAAVLYLILNTAISIGLRGRQARLPATSPAVEGSPPL